MSKKQQKIHAILKKYNGVITGLEDVLILCGFLRQLAIAYVKTNDPWEDIRERIDVACKNSLPEYSRPAEICHIKEFPYTAAGKVDFRALEKMAESSPDSVGGIV